MEVVICEASVMGGGIDKLRPSPTACFWSWKHGFRADMTKAQKDAVAQVELACLDVLNDAGRCIQVCHAAFWRTRVLHEVMLRLGVRRKGVSVGRVILSPDADVGSKECDWKSLCDVLVEEIQGTYRGSARGWHQLQAVLITGGAADFTPYSIPIGDAAFQCISDWKRHMEGSTEWSKQKF